MLEVRLIGKFEIQYDGSAVVLSTRAAQSLFAYLILTAGTLHRREKLAGMLWPDESEPIARTYLRQELWRIRRALPRKLNVEYLLADNLTIAFNQSASYLLDVDGLKNLRDTATSEELFKSLSNYQGELLPGFYEDWVSLEREYLRVLFEQKMARLLEILEKEQRWQDIVEWAERWISLAQAPEQAYRALMLAYNALGDQAKIVSTYERCKQALRALDLEPSDQTRALAFKRNNKVNIPIPLTSFIGREKELKEVASLLRRSRLVTLTGSGGVGKTRLAVQVTADVVDRFPDGIWFLDLAPLHDANLIAGTLAGLLDLREGTEIPITQVLINFLQSRRALVVFDNCEHLIESCSQLVYLLLSTCGNLTILATSRESLRVAGEIPYRVPSLEVPGLNVPIDGTAYIEFEGIRLFVERAAANSPGFQVNDRNVRFIAQICQHLDGIPLAIELAAARASTLTVEQISTRLDNCFNLLTRGLRSALPRHRTLRATIEWSYDLLSEEESRLFRSLAVFKAGWILEAAENVCSVNEIVISGLPDLLSQLVNKSLVKVETGAHEFRYLMLETIRQFASIKMVEFGEEKNLRNRHLKYFLQLSEQAEIALKGPAQVEWYERLYQERDNIRAALEWAKETDIEAGLYFTSRLFRFWERFDLQEGARWLSEFIQKPESMNFPLARAKALLVYGRILGSMNQFIQTRSIARECLDLFVASGDQQGEIDALLLLGYVRWALDSAEDVEIHQQALELAESIDDIWRQALALYQLGANYSGDKQLACWEKAIHLMRQTKDWRMLAIMLRMFGSYSMLNGNLAQAQKTLDEVEKLNDEIKDKVIGSDLLDARARIAIMQEDYNRAHTYLQEELKITEELGARMNSLWCRSQFGYLALREGNIKEAQSSFLETAQEFHKDRVIIGTVYNLEGMADLYTIVGKPEWAARLIGWADDVREKIGDPRPLIEQTDISKIVANCMEIMGEIGFSREYDTGRKMTIDEAVVYAIENARQT